MSETRSADVIILGAGPAGCTAAVYCTRAGLKTVVFGGAAPGGQLLLTSDIENFPGLPEPVTGAELMERMHRQCRRLGALVLTEEAVSLALEEKPFSVVSSSGEIYAARAVIIATGAKSRWLGLESEKSFIGKGVSGCATCDGFFHKGKEVCVIGGGDTALEDALFLTKFASKITVIHRRNSLRASNILQEKARKNPKIAFLWDSVVEEVLGKEGVTAVRLKNLKTGKTEELPCEGIFVAIGHAPDTAILKKQLKTDENGFVITDGRTGTSVEGVFAAGDIADPRYRQAVTAAGSGCIAAIEAARFLQKAD
ncbi:MAG: thioredoxin-disulfide reductase [bacterium]